MRHGVREWALQQTFGELHRELEVFRQPGGERLEQRVEAQNLLAEGRQGLEQRVRRRDEAQRIMEYTAHVADEFVRCARFRSDPKARELGRRASKRLLCAVRKSRNEMPQESALGFHPCTMRPVGGE